MRICINSQTPFIKFKLSYRELLEKYGGLPDPVELKDLAEGEDYDLSPGGVTAMVYPLLKKMLNQGYLSGANWVSLGIEYPPRLKVDNILVSHVEIPEPVLREYTRFKEELWAQLHGLSNASIFDKGYEAYAWFNWVNAEAMLHHWRDTDVFYIQDFQLLISGGLIGPPAPAIIRWHVPFEPQKLPYLTHRAVLKWIEGFDAVVVSTRRDLEGLIKSSYRGRAHQIYPFLDPDAWNSPASSLAVSEARRKIGLKADENLLLMVARMDRIKSHDVAIRALSHLKNRGKYHLALIGNGSFSSSSKGGLGHGKGAIWRAELESLVRDLKLDDSVTFLGHVPAEEVKAAYSLASSVLLTSVSEGFGLSVLEGWINKKPVVVSTGAGSSELVVSGSNGFTFPPGDDLKASECIEKSVNSGSEKLGDNGFETAKQCHINVAAERERAIFEEAISIYA